MNGETDPSHNMYLSAALNLARNAQMPKSTVEDAIKRATSKKDGETENIVRYEGLSKAGVAVIVECLVSNPAKTNAEIRSLFKKNDAISSNIMYLFNNTGRICIGPGSTGQSVAEMMDTCIDLDVDEIQEDEEDQSIELLVDLKRVHKVQKALAEGGFEIKEVSTGFVPIERIQVESGEKSEMFSKLLEVLEAHEDVVQVYHNAN